MTAPESQDPPPPASLRERAEAGDPEAITLLALLTEPRRLGYSTLPLRNPVDLAAILHRHDTRPAAGLSTAQLRDGANHQDAPGGANR